MAPALNSLLPNSLIVLKNATIPPTPPGGLFKLIYGTAARRQVEFEREFHPDEYWTYDPNQYGYIGDTYSLPMGGFPYWDYPVFAQPAPEIFPTVRVIPPGVREGVLPTTDPGAEAVVPPPAEPQVEGDSGSTGGDGPVTSTRVYKESDYIPDPTPQRETDWDWVYDQYVILNPPQEAPVAAMDWGDVAGTILGGIATAIGGPAEQIYSGFGGTYGGGTSAPLPTKVTVDTATGKITPCRRRRRRRLLTASDLNDLAALKTIIGGGSAMNAAVVKAIR